MTAEHRDQSPAESARPVLSYESWLEQTQTFDRLSSQRQREVLQDGISLFIQTANDFLAKLGGFYRFTTDQQIMQRSGEFEEVMKHVGAIDIIKTDRYLLKEGEKNRYRILLNSKSYPALIISDREQGDNQVTVLDLQEFTFDSAGERSVKREIASLSNLQIVKFINWGAQEAVKHRSEFLNRIY